MALSKIIKHQSALLATVKLYRRLGAGWLDAFVHSALCIMLIA